MKHTQKKIVVVGTGYVGLPAALMWAKAGHAVVGVDINENVVRAINEGVMHINENELRELMADPVVKKNLSARTSPCEGDVFVVAVPTPVDHARKTADLAFVESAVESFCPFVKRGNLVIIESTIPPRTCRDVVAPIIEKHTGMTVPGDIMLAHCPERILPGDIFREIVENDRLIGGMDDASTEAAAQVYASFVTGALHRTDDISAELSKLMENTYRDVNIALANELAAICENLGADPRKVIGFANKHPRVRILNPGIGVGGHCIPVDPWFLREIAPYDSRLISTARLINDEVPLRVAGKIRRAVRDIASPRIVLLGATYKRDCEDQRESPAHEVAAQLERDGYDFAHHDPLVSGKEYASLVEIAKGADLIAVLVPHSRMVEELRAQDAAIRAAMRTPRIEYYEK
ncbi:MAG: nucleotide sugar dehydrogenase [Verrucomicrobiaceae bacterium]|nr:nucleotide sugar dehydrogenase [Verrucomicrobiaceae bacterium]